jgi:hypothetical protein
VRRFGGDESKAMQPALGMEHEAAGPKSYAAVYGPPAAGERCRLRVAVETAAERDCDVLAVHEDVSQCFSL